MRFVLVALASRDPRHAGTGCQVDARGMQRTDPPASSMVGTASGSKVVCCSSARRCAGVSAAAQTDRASTGPAALQFQCVGRKVGDLLWAQLDQVAAAFPQEKLCTSP